MIHALPGMGADRRMFPAPWDTLPDFTAHDWPAYREETTIEAVARRVTDVNDIRDNDVVVGTSLGGMVAREIARIRRLRAIVLVASAVSNKEVSPLFRLLHPLATITPFGALKKVAAKSDSILAQMFAGSDPEFVRAMCSAIFRWDGAALDQTRCVRIHGRRDHVISRPGKVDLLLNGGHLITMTHATECVEFVRRTI